MSNKGKGRAIQWLRDHMDYPHEDWCLIWPFSKIRGYGNFGYLGEHFYSHTYMCEIVHGPPPSPSHQPAHSCGRGDEGCVNPRHLSWKTPEQNQRDKRIHGTAYRDGRVHKLKPEDVIQIRSMRGKMTHDEMARMFGVSRRNIGAVLDGRSWGIRKIKLFTPDEDAKLRELHDQGKNFSQIAKEMNRAGRAVSHRGKTIGLLPQRLLRQ